MNTWPQRAVLAIRGRGWQVTYLEGLSCIWDDEPAPKEIEHLDLLKIDIQGGELPVFQNGEAMLAETVAIQTEVSFMMWYQDQPPFGAVDLELRRQGSFYTALPK